MKILAWSAGARSPLICRRWHGSGVAKGQCKLEFHMKKLFLGCALLALANGHAADANPLDTDICRNYLLLSNEVGKITNPGRTPDVVKKMEDDRKKMISELGVAFCKEQYKELQKLIKDNEHFAALAEQFK